MNIFRGLLLVLGAMLVDVLFIFSLGVSYWLAMATMLLGVLTLTGLATYLFERRPKISVFPHRHLRIVRWDRKGDVPWQPNKQSHS